MTILRILLAFLTFSICVGSHAFAQEETGSALATRLSSIEAEVDRSGAIAPEDLPDVQAEIEATKSAIAAIRQETAQVRDYASEALRVGATIEEFAAQRALLESPEGQSPLPEGADDLNRLRGVLIAERDSYATALEQAQQTRAALQSRPAEIAQALVTQRAKANEALADISPSTDGGSVLERLSRLRADVADYTAVQSIENLEAELSTITPREDIEAARLLLLQTRISHTDDRLKRVEEALASTRRGKADTLLKEASEARDRVAGAAQPIRAYAAGNVTLAEELNRIAEKAPLIEQKTVRIREQIASLDQSSRTVERVLAAGRVSDELAAVLRKLKSGLPKISALKQIEVEAADAQVSQQLKLILWQDQLRTLGNRQGAVEAVLGVPAQDVSDAARELVDSRAAILSELIDSGAAQTDRLVEQDIVVNEALSKTQGLTTQLERRLLWLPSGTVFSGDFQTNILKSANWLFDPVSWRGVWHDFLAGFRKLPVLGGVFLVLPLLLFGLRPIVLRAMADLTSRVGNVGRDTYWTTPMALGLTLVLALPVPVLIGAAAGIIVAGSDAQSFSDHFAKGLAAMSSSVFALLTFRAMCRADGLFTGHFHWSASANRQLSQTLSWLVWIIGISSTCLAMALASGQVELRYGLAVGSFMTSSLALTVFNFIFFQPSRGVAAKITPSGKAGTLVTLVFPLLVAAPIAIGAMPLFGFFDTAIALQTRLFQSGGLLILAAVIFGVMMRVYNVAHRRFALGRLLAKRAAAEEARARASEDGDSGEVHPVPDEEEPLEIEDISQQARQVLFGLSAISFVVGLWMIWSPLLPALAIADDIVLWNRVRLTDGVETSEGITLWNIILSGCVIAGGFIGAKNIRGLLEVGVFQRLKLDAGERYATVTILGYLIVATGLVIGLSQLGIDWSKLQWIVAALGVGLGFGLQEIVANFISGLIILFERPVRVGDTVSIGGLSGTVTNIKIRATTITDFDNREVILPNKSIITENVTNWTLKDSTTRVLLSVGVAYGSDIEKVHGLLMDIVEAHPEVLETPAPSVLFMNHGDSSLDFELRIFIANVMRRYLVTHEINTAINKVFTQHNIEIPFPQRTLHFVEPEQASVEE